MIFIEGSESSHEWETTQSVLQESTSTQTVNKTTSHATGSPVTTGCETRGVTAWGVIDETHQSASANRSWGESGGGWESASGGSTRNRSTSSTTTTPTGAKRSMP
jgi:hypothetical protein